MSEYLIDILLQNVAVHVETLATMPSGDAQVMQRRRLQSLICDTLGCVRDIVHRDAEERTTFPDDVSSLLTQVGYTPRQQRQSEK